ncbi:LysR substrate-binding domain-containing protein [Kinneretia asaccharophila]|uniref:LysR family transcriptional regulator n=1 Tax=Roseateles asaccharophilus TaxID=582607 RepID=A0A4R6NFM5_9BURK|nr:LysR family transcriptional regulator [Roseateles asaccharophilus]MDN3543238.1 LysR substrate-binding domain-containing protein [Roseateles asaccharophilus]TDP13064.1 LysR family transcriptional regulator [Roseateles asaccharophilus]
MDQLRALRVFVRVIDEGSFASAARALDLAPAVVTRLVAELEDHLGARLINRTTRRLALTDIGEAYLERARRILSEVDEATALATSASTEPRGHLRVLVPPAIAVHQLAKHLPRFHKQFPQVTVELSSPGGVEAVDESFDITILHTRHPLDGDFVARRLARTEVILCASPEYLNRRGRPGHPDELREHDTLLPPRSELQRGIVFQRGAWGDDEPPGETHTLVPRKPVLATSHLDTNYAAALHGLGVAGLPSFLIEDALMEHALERVLPEWRLFSVDIWAAMPSRKHMPARTRAFLDFLLEVFGGEDRDPWLAAAGCETRVEVCGAAAPQAAAPAQALVEPLSAD